MKLNLKNTLFRFSSLTLVLTAAASAQVDLIQLKLDAIERLSGFSGSGQRFAGAVYAMANGEDSNLVVAYGRNSDGTLELLGSYATGGRGAAFDGGEGLDPLISAYALELTPDNRHLLAVNAGSSTVTVFNVNRDFTLTRSSETFTFGVGPNSIAADRGRFFVSNIDADGDFAGEPDQEGSVLGFLVTRRGNVIPDFRTFRTLDNRPSAVRISPDGRNLLVTSINSGSAALESGSEDELVMYGLKYGRLTSDPVAAVTSTLRGNSEGRNLPSAIGFEVVRENGRQFAVVTEAREFQPDGSPPAFPALQTGSVSTWEIVGGRNLEPVNLDVIPDGQTITDGERTACWLTFSEDQDYFWVSNAIDASISTYSFDAGQIAVSEEIAIQGIGVQSPDPAIAFGETQGWIDLDTDRNGEYVYQLYGLAGTIGVFRVGEGGSLSLVEEVSGALPEQNTQGIVAF